MCNCNLCLFLSVSSTTGWMTSHFRFERESVHLWLYFEEMAEWPMAVNAWGCPVVPSAACNALPQQEAGRRREDCELKPLKHKAVQPLHCT